MRFRIKLAKLHEKSGLTVYGAAKASNLAYNTVNKYVSEDVISDSLPAQVLQLVEFYGADWRDPSVIEVIDEDPEIETPLAASA